MRNLNDSVEQINTWIAYETKKKVEAQKEIDRLLAVLEAKEAAEVDSINAARW
jgi:hypothetical protein